MTSRKRKKCSSNRSKIKRTGEVEKVGDWIGDLPDALLEQILSHLLFKDVVRTSLLSKRWRNLWVSHSVIHLVEGRNRVSFIDFVERLVGERDSKTIHEFYLHCGVMSDSRRISKWVDSVLSRGVQRLSLQLEHVLEEIPFMLPSSVFTCASIQSLRLHLSSPVAIPSRVCFPNLRSLDLEDVVFPDFYSTYKLISSCVVLEELQFVNCIWRDVNHVCVYSPSLKELHIKDYILSKDDDPNNSRRSLFIIFGRRLEEFSFMGNFRYVYCLEDVPALTQASLELNSTRQGFFTDVTDEALRVYMLLRGVSNVRTLILSNRIIEALTIAEDQYTIEIPVFPHLNRLELTACDVNIATGGLLSLLQKSPCLKTLKFEKGIRLEPSNGDEEWTFDRIPLCFSTHLKTVIVDHYSGGKIQRDAIELLLKHATCLEKISLDIFSFDLAGDPPNVDVVYEHLDAVSNQRCHPY